MFTEIPETDDVETKASRGSNISELQFKVEFRRYFYSIDCALDFLPFLALPAVIFLGERFIATQKIAMLNLSSAFKSVVTGQDHIYPNT